MSGTGYARRTRARTAIERLGNREDVADVTLIPAWEDPTGRPTVEIVLTSRMVPPVVLRELGEARLSILHTHRSSGLLRVVAVAE